MERRLGIELSSSSCAVIELDVSRRGPDVPARVIGFHSIPWTPADPDLLVARLRALKDSSGGEPPAVVTAWGTGTTYQHLVLPSAEDESLCVGAMRHATPASSDSASIEPNTVRAVLVDDVAAWQSTTLRDATVVTAPVAGVERAVAPLVAAGLRIAAVVTPAIALASLSRLLAYDPEQATRAYVAIDAEATALAIVRKGILLFAREFSLPFKTAAAGDQWSNAADEAHDFVRRLAPELKRSFLTVKQQSRQDVEQIVTCGRVPNLRALTAPLMQALKVDVAALDGSQALALETPDVDAISKAGEMRLAWAAVADTARSIDLRQRSAAGRRQLRTLPARLVGAVAIVLLVTMTALLLYARATRARADHDARTLRDQVARLESQLKVQHGKQAPPDGTVQKPNAPSGDRAVGQASPPAPAMPAVNHALPKALPAVRTSTVVRVPTTQHAAPLPADPVVRSILYSADRRLALVGERVVRVGDPVEGGVIVDIEPRAIVVRRPWGELHRIEVRKPR